MVGLAFARADDYERVTVLACAEVSETVHGCKSFILDEVTHARLLQVAGEPDYDRAKRHKKSKMQAHAADLSGHW